MGARVIVVGAGLIGANIAYRLARRGAAVTVVDTVGAAAGASGASFGWINASFFADAAHFRLRHAGIAAWHRLLEEVPSDAVHWPGCLWWEEQGAAFDAQADRLRGLGYGVEEIDRAGFAALEPHVANPPERALVLAAEGVAEAEAQTRRMLRAAMDHGAKLMLGVRVQAIATRSGQLCGVETSVGPLACERLVVACGNGAPEILHSVDVALPMLSRPGLLLRSTPIAPMLAHILVSPGQELRQNAAGQLIAPTVEGHQGDDSAAISENPAVSAERAMGRLRAVLPDVALEWEEVSCAFRPVPQDGLPVMGAAGPEGLFVAVMHSGVTLAAIAAEILADEVLGQEADAALVGPYRPARF